MRRLIVPLVALAAMLAACGGDDGDETGGVAVPDVLGTSYPDAVHAIEDAGLEVAAVAIPSDAEPGSVVQQVPEAGIEVAEGTEVVISFSEREPEEGRPIGEEEPAEVEPTEEQGQGEAQPDRPAGNSADP